MIRIGSEQQVALRIALHELRNVGFQVHNIQPEFLRNPVLKFNRLGKMKTRVDKIDWDGVIYSTENVQQNEAVGLKRAGRK